MIMFDYVMLINVESKVRPSIKGNRDVSKLDNSYVKQKN